MTNIVIRKGKKKNELSVSVRGHCDRDVCIAVSAITNTLAQYTDDFRDNNSRFRTDSVRTAYGSAQLTARSTDGRLFGRYLAGATAIMLGYILYAHQFPEEITVDSNMDI